MLNFVLGIVASICAAMVVAIFARYVVPYIRGFLNDTPRIDGDWRIHITETSQNRGILTIDQQGARVRAFLKFPDGSRSFVYMGRFSSGHLVLTFEQKKLESLNVGAMVFRLGSGGNTMIGRTLFWHNDRSEFVSDQCEAIKVR